MGTRHVGRGFGGQMPTKGKRCQRENSFLSLEVFGLDPPLSTEKVGRGYVQDIAIGSSKLSDLQATN